MNCDLAKKLKQIGKDGDTLFSFYCIKCQDLHMGWLSDINVKKYHQWMNLFFEREVDEEEVEEWKSLD